MKSNHHWFSNKKAALREMYRVLRPGGQLVLICAAAPAFHEWFSLLEHVLRATVGPAAATDPPSLPTAAEVQSLLRGSGLKITYIANPVALQPVIRPESFVRLMATVAPHWGTDLPEQVRLAVELRVAALMRNGWPDGFPNTWAAVEAMACRTR